MAGGRPPTYTDTFIIEPSAICDALSMHQFISNWNYDDLLANVLSSEDDCHTFLAKYGFLKNTMTCNKGHDMILIKRAKHKNCLDSAYWRCRTGYCNTHKSIRHGSFFANSKLSFRFTLKFIYFWARDLSLQNITHECRVCPRTAVDWANFMRDICCLFIEDHYRNIKIGGPGVVVEIDESCFGHRKYNRGRDTRQQWVFGGIERGTGQFFMVPVQDKKKDTLIPIILEHIEKGSIICADSAPMYDTLDKLGYELKRVNHSQNFVNPLDKDAYTQNIENAWMRAKRKFKQSNGTSRALFTSYLCEAQFRILHSTNNKDIFQEIMYWILHYYDISKTDVDFNDIFNDVDGYETEEME